MKTKKKVFEVSQVYDIATFIKMPENLRKVVTYDSRQPKKLYMDRTCFRCDKKILTDELVAVPYKYLIASDLNQQSALAQPAKYLLSDIEVKFSVRLVNLVEPHELL